MREFLGYAVENGVLRFTSVSALARFNPAEDGCNGKWWYRYVAGIKEPKKKSKELGDRLHKQLEHYNLTGQDVLDPILRAGLHLIPPPDPLRLVAPEINLEIAGVRIVGAIDLLDLTDPACPEVIDYKTTSDIRSYAKPARALVETTQMPVYAFDVLENRVRADRVRLTHIYFQTKGRMADPRSAVVGLTDLERRYNSIQSLIGEMKAIAREPAIEKVPLNEAACDAFGGCAYRGVCPRKRSVGRIMNLFNSTIQQRKAAGAVAAEVPARKFTHCRFHNSPGCFENTASKSPVMGLSHCAVVRTVRPLENQPTEETMCTCGKCERAEWERKLARALELQKGAEAQAAAFLARAIAAEETLRILLEDWKQNGEATP